MIQSIAVRTARIDVSLPSESTSPSLRTPPCLYDDFITWLEDNIWIVCSRLSYRSMFDEPNNASLVLANYPYLREAIKRPYDERKHERAYIETGKSF
jgi:hypothetical protein